MRMATLAHPTKRNTEKMPNLFLQLSLAPSKQIRKTSAKSRDPSAICRTGTKSAEITFLNLPQTER